VNISKCSILHRECSLQLTICACDSWGTALDVGFNSSVDNTYDWKGIRKNEADVNSTKAYIKMATFPFKLSTDVTQVPL
jgi:hypothetical protein